MTEAIENFSVACCNPAFAYYDEQYVARLKEALGWTGVEARVSVVASTDVFFGLKLGYMRQPEPLLNKYGAVVAPALFSDGELVL